MAGPSRGIEISRRRWLLAGLAAPVFRAWGADSLTVTFDGDNLRVAAPNVHFLKGKSLNRLKQGSTVEYVAQITLFRDQFLTQFKRSETRFIVSYDVWGEDKFAVSTPGPPPRSAPNLSLAETEAWCLDSVGIAAEGIVADRPFWLQLGLRTVPPKMSSVLGDSGISVDLIDLISQAPGADERQILQTGPLRLADLVRTPRKGRNG